MDQDIFPFELTTDRLHLRVAVPEDAPAIFALVDRSSAELTAWLPWAKKYKLKSAQDWCRRAMETRRDETFFQFSIFLTDGTLIGDISAAPDPQDDRGCEIGYWLGTPFVGQGYMTEAIAAVVNAVRSAGYKRVFVRIDQENARSRRCVERAGFFLEEIRPKASETEGEIPPSECVYVHLKK